jgi:hypothetical protein
MCHACRASGTTCGSAIPRLVLERGNVALGERLAARQEAIELAQLREPERALQVGEPVVVAQIHHLGPQPPAGIARGGVGG